MAARVDPQTEFLNKFSMNFKRAEEYKESDELIDEAELKDCALDEEDEMHDEDPEVAGEQVQVKALTDKE